MKVNIYFFTSKKNMFKFDNNVNKLELKFQS